MALWLLLGLILVATVLLSLAPSVAEPAFPLADKLFHLTAYGLLTLVGLLAGVWRPARGAGPLAGRAVWLLAAVVGLGVVIEIVQGAVGRDPSVLDALADLFGALLAAGIWSVLPGRPPGAGLR